MSEACNERRRRTRALEDSERDMNDQTTMLPRPAPAPDGRPDHEPRGEGVLCPLRLRMVPLNPSVGDVAGNEALIASAINAASEDGIELLVLPELVICGYPPEDLLLRRDFLDACHAAVARLAALTQKDSIAVLLGAPQLLGGKLYNAAVLLRGGRAEYVSRKQALPYYGVFDEKRWFTRGHEDCLVEIAGVNVGITVCEDIWIDGGPISTMHARRAELVVNLSASPYERGKKAIRHDLLATRAREAGCTLAYCNLLGGQDELVFDGHCLLVDSNGNTALESTPFSAATLDAGPASTPIGPDGADPLSEVYAALCLATRDYVTKSGFERVVLGLSGGIDSALVLLIACDALGPDKVSAVVMPSPYSSPATQGDAVQLAGDCGADLHQLEIAEPMRAYQSTLSGAFTGLKDDVTEENIQARIRGNLLMALSNKFGWLVLSTGNKSETAVGYTTLYGDMAGGFAVLKDCPKTLVFELTRWRAERGDLTSPALERISSRAPSAELRADQRDTDSLPPYEVLDPILACYVERAMGIDEISAELEIERAVIERIIDLVNRAEHKRRQAPPGPKLTLLAFGRDRRMPIANGFRP